jgi:hypothetical protein
VALEDVFSVEVLRPRVGACTSDSDDGVLAVGVVFVSTHTKPAASIVGLSAAKGSSCRGFFSCFSCATREFFEFSDLGLVGKRVGFSTPVFDWTDVGSVSCLADVVSVGAGAGEATFPEWID